MNNNWHKKEKPLLGLTGLGGGVDGLAVVSGAATKKYIEDVHSTYLYLGNGSSRSISNGIDLSGEGGLVWTKARTSSTYSENALTDTVRGVGQEIQSNSNAAQNFNAARVNAFNSDGYDIGTSQRYNNSGTDYVSWSFRKTEKFFDIVKFTGNSDSTQQVAHNLGTVPGCMMLKNISNTDSWSVYHRGTDTLTPQNEAMILNSTNGVSSGSSYWNDTAPTSTHFTLGSGLNEDGEEYIVYLFAGSKGSSDNAVDFDGDDYLSMPVSNSDFDFGASDSLTLEAFVNMDDLAPNGGQGYNSILNRWGGSGNYCWGIDLNNSGNIYFYFLNGSGSITTATSSGASVSLNEWYHIAVVKDVQTGRFFVNGKACGTFTWDGGSTNNSQPIHVGNLGDSNAYPIDGSISNARITMGQALYTVDFNVPHDPLTQTSQNAISSNVKLLCCNQSTVTGSTVAPSTISASGDPTAVTNASIFDDSDAYILGEDGDKSAIRCGGYIGNGSSGGPIIDFGWQPQWLLIKRVSGNGNDWLITDTMRGFTSSNADDFYLRANDTNAEFDLSNDSLTINSTGFSINYNSDNYNAAGKRYLYMAIRGTDGHVAKPPEAGTDSFNVVLGAGNGVIPEYAANFAVNMAIVRQYANTQNNYIASRLTGTNYLQTNDSTTESSTWPFVFDWNAGWNESANNTNISWMWKRGQGFDSVTWTGDSVSGRQLQHGLNAVPEMMWIKRRGAAGDNWYCYHKGVNGGVNPEEYTIALNDPYVPNDSLQFLKDTAPTATHFTIGSNTAVNYDAQTYVNYLFSSVTGISKVGSYTGTESSNSITTGFQPRFVFVKCTSTAASWVVWDTTRGVGNYLLFNSNNAQGSASVVTFDSTGFTLTGTSDSSNGSGESYIYYAHA